ncbi:unnamed protein product [Aphanomyces euteiches]|uniref:Peptidase A1 domain-containing protein n=1 Tax=Aphanomyces euteiches TaxID=100861 RepID=A0A6G0XLH4_9STRA|nr:hypothetical protein Ae201684_003609 [Aphanomyces euteiches]KAH9084566.1 hypothetical protein Ae201684P_001808 [Aphanomyces euteiches]
MMVVLRLLMAVALVLPQVLANASPLIRVPLYRRPKENTAMKPLVVEGALNADKRLRNHVPLTNFVEFQFYGDMALGTPPQHLLVTFDTGSSDLWVPGSACSHCAGSHRFTPDRSSTFRLASDPNFTIAYGSGEARGLSGADTIYVGGYTAKNVPLGVVELEADSLSNMKPDGLMGLAFDGLATFSHPPPFMVLLRQNPELAPQFSFYLTPEPNTNGSEVMFGGFDPARMEGSVWQTMDVIPQYGYWTFWRVQLHSMIVGDAEDVCDAGCIAFVDTGTSLLGVPEANYDKVIQFISDAATRAGCYCSVGAYGFQCFMCSKDNFPPLRFGLGGHSFFSLAGADYTMCIGATCLVLIQKSGQDMWTLGDVFLKMYYSLYNVQTKQIAFACPVNARHCGNETPAMSRPVFDHVELLDPHMILVLFMSGLSIFGCAFIIGTYWLYPTLQTKRVLALLYWLSWCNLIYNGLVWLGSLSQYSSSSAGCAVQLVVQQFAGVAILLLSAVISIELLRAVSGWRAQTTDYSGRYHFVVWSCSTACACVTIWTGVLGYVPDTYGPGMACWVDHTPIWSRIVFFFVPVLLILILSLHALQVAIHRLHSTNLIQTETGRRSSQLLVSYVIVFGVTSVVPALVGLTALYVNVPDVVLYASEMCFYAQGLLHCFVWACSPSFQQAYTQRQYAMGDEEVEYLVAE